MLGFSLNPEKWGEAEATVFAGAPGVKDPGTPGQAADRGKALCLHIQDRWGRRSERDLVTAEGLQRS